MVLLAVIARYRVRLLVALLAPAVLMASSGVTLVQIDSVAMASRASDEGDWPCKHHHCGCLNAEMCREHCCCFKSKSTAHSCCGSKAPAGKDEGDDASHSASGFRIVIRAAGCTGNGAVSIITGIHWLPTSTRPALAVPDADGALAANEINTPSNHFPGLDPPPPRHV